MMSEHTTYIALLYSIGIAENRRLSMQAWRSMMADLGLIRPRTVIATGNAMFDFAETGICEMEAMLEDAFESRFGRRVDTIVRTATAFRHLVQRNPFLKEAEQDPSRVIARIMREPLSAKKTTKELARFLTQGEQIAVIHGDLWVHFKGEPSQSKLMPILGSKRLGIGTVRNWNTIRRVNRLLDVPAV
jgi:uncharacterized protein (DUF1697 family)